MQGTWFPVRGYVVLPPSIGPVVRTAPEAGMLLKMRVGSTTCTGSAGEPARTDTLPYPALSLMAGEDLDALFLGSKGSFRSWPTTRFAYTRQPWRLGGYMNCDDREQWNRGFTLDVELRSTNSR